MNGLRPLQMVEREGLVSYWSKGPQNNYSSVKRVLGVVKFPPKELTHYQNLARKKGFNLTVGVLPGDLSAPVKRVEVKEVEPEGHIDRKRGVLKTASAEWVINCTTGKLINVRDARFIGVSSKDNLPYWIHLDAAINDSPVAYPSVFGDNKPSPRRIECYAPKTASHKLSDLVSKAMKEVSK